MHGTNDNSPRVLVRVLQIVTAAILAGPLLFLGFIFTQPAPPPVDTPSQSYIGAAAGAFVILMTMLIRLRPRPASVPQDFRNDNFDPAADPVFTALLPVYQVEHIIKIALLEGVAFLNIIAFKMERQSWTLGVAGLLLALIVVRFPTVAGLQQRMADDSRDWHFD